MFLNKELQDKVLWFNGDGKYRFNCELSKNDKKFILMVKYNPLILCYESWFYYKGKDIRLLCYRGETDEYIKVINTIVEYAYYNIEEHFMFLEEQ